METIARATDAYKIYGEGETEVRALDGASVELYKGQFTAIMGPSGSGKSTLMHCMAGLDPLTSGETYIEDINLSRLNDKEITRLRSYKLGFIFQSFNLIPTLSARENILLPLNLAGRYPDMDWFDKLAEVTGLGDRLSHRPAELSGGQQQRVAVARALMSRPEIVFGDEPTGNLDSNASTEILEFLRMVVDTYSQTIVLVTHDPRAASYADRILFLSDGKPVGELLDPKIDDIIDRLK